jgi:GNAT superfamily N-acetyltransferase
MQPIISFDDNIDLDEVIDLYRANHWSSADKPELLLPALRNSHLLITARVDGRLVGLGNAISDGYLVVYFPHLLVYPEYQGRGIGRSIMDALLSKYKNFHQLMLTADGATVKFYERMGFVRAGKTVPMWVYDGCDH